MLKIITKTLLDRNKWYFPAGDLNTMDWYFYQGLTDINPALEMAAPYLKNYRTVIQAGGAVGIWPLRLSQVFDRVITFEPEHVNYQCLIRNIAGVNNITVYNAALGDVEKKVSMILEPRMKGHHGAFQVQDGGNIDMFRIDALNIVDLDLLYLDIEGSEYSALAGAKQTIDRCSPVIGIEEKGFNTRYNNGANPRDLLNAYGYTPLGKPYKDDYLFIRR